MRPAGIAAAVGLASLALASSASAETFVVDSLKDAVDPEPTNDVCATAAGECTLRAAIETANHFVGNDEIKLPKGTIKLTIPKSGSTQNNSEGELDVTEAVLIDGRGPTKTVIKQTARDRVLRNDAPFSGFCCPGLQLNDVALTGGRIGGAGENGGAGLQNNAFALLSNVVIKKNVINSDSADNVPGGGILTSGIIAMAETTVRDNVSKGRGQTLAQAAGVFVQNGSATIQDNSKVLSNSVEFRDPEGDRVAQGGGVFVANPGSEPGDAVLITDSTVAGNTVSGSPDADGGGVFAGVGANLDIQRSTISGNSAGRGGGLYLVGVSSVAINNSTVSGNVATRDGGAAIFHQAAAEDIAVSQTTIAGNAASQGHFPIEAGEQAVTGSFGLFASIVFNPGKECGPPAEAGALESDGWNVVGDKSCNFNESLFDLKADPDLGPLARNGGPTKTHALKASSPAIDHVPCAPGIDQRGLPRPQRAECDSGSFERKF